MKITLDKFQLLLLSMYLFFNTYALVYILYYEKTFSDFEKPATNINLVFLSYFFTIIPFILFCIFVYPFLQNKLTSINYKKINLNVENKLTIFVLILQIIFLFYNLFTGVNSAGSTIKTDTPVKFFFILVSPDIFFVILYGIARENKYFKYNLIIYLISNIQRGWMGAIFFVIILELYIYYKKYAFSKKMIYIFVIFGLGILIFLPYVSALKWAARVYFGGLTDNFIGELQTVITLGNKSYIDSLLETISFIFGRFQILSNVYLILENMEILINLKEQNQFVSVFSIGLPQLSIYRIFQLNYISLDSYFVSLMIENISNENISWNTNLGWIGWIIPQPELFFVYILYSVLLIFLVTLFTKFIGGKYLFFISWYMTLALFLHGWIQAYLGYLINLIIFFLVLEILKSIKKSILLKGNHNETN